jgi:hypothetical protein
MEELKKKCVRWLALGVIDLEEAFDLIEKQARIEETQKQVEEMRKDLEAVTIG